MIALNFATSVAFSIAAVLAVIAKLLGTDVAFTEIGTLILLANVFILRGQADQAERDIAALRARASS